VYCAGSPNVARYGRSKAPHTAKKIGAQVIAGVRGKDVQEFASAFRRDRRDEDKNAVSEGKSLVI
jgi:hypothetical protein